MPWGFAIAAAGTVAGAEMQSDASKSAANTQAKAGQAAIQETQGQADLARTDLAPFRDLGTQALGTLKDSFGFSTPTQSIADVAAQIRANFPDIQGNAEATNSVSDVDLVNGFMKSIPSALLNPSSGTPEQMDKMRSLLAQAQQATNPAPQSSAATNPNFGSLLKPFNFDISQDPGYQFRLDQGTKAINNSAAASGSSLSGATLKQLLEFGQNYASGEFNNAFNRDQQTKNQVFSMLTGAAGMGQGSTTTGVQAGQASAANIGNTITGIGNAQAAGTVGAANATGGALSGLGNSGLSYLTLKNLINNNGSTSGIMGGAGGGGANNDFSNSQLFAG